MFNGVFSLSHLTFSHYSSNLMLQEGCNMGLSMDATIIAARHGGLTLLQVRINH